MHGGIAELPDGSQVIRRRIALVAIKTVTRILRVQLAHLPVPRHLGDYRRRRNRRTALVAVHDATLSHQQIRECGTRPPARHPASGASDITARRIACSDAWWMLMVSISAGDASATAHASACERDLLEQILALGRRNRFRIAEPRNMPIGMQHDRARHHRPGQASAADLVHTAHPVEAQPAQDVLERACRGDSVID